MPPKGGNSKKEAGRARKAENEQKKKDAVAADKERKEAESWQEGAKGRSTKDDREEKRRAELARKAENARLLAEEEAASASAKPKAAPKAGAKKKNVADTKPAGPGAIAAGGGLASISVGEKEKESAGPEEVESFAASGIDNALDLLEVVTAKMDKASVGQQAAGIERHPERRFKAAFEAYQERELPNLKKEHPGLRLQQYKDILYKQFQKSPDNPYVSSSPMEQHLADMHRLCLCRLPNFTRIITRASVPYPSLRTSRFNQVTVAYDASKEEKVDALKAKKAQVEERLREKSL